MREERRGSSTNEEREKKDYKVVHIFVAVARSPAFWTSGLNYMMDTNERKYEVNEESLKKD